MRREGILASGPRTQRWRFLNQAVHFTVRSSPLLIAFPLLCLPLFAKCPIPPNGTLEVRVSAGNLIIDTSGVDSVEVEVTDKQIAVQEICEKNLVRIEGSGRATPALGVPEWKIRVPKTVSLDLTTQGGNISASDTDGRETNLRTTGGTVTAGNIKGNALIVTQGGSIKAGDIGGIAELRSEGGGALNVRNIGGPALLKTKGGEINAGMVKGSVTADTGGGSITIREVNGQLVAKTEAGNINSTKVLGAFDGHAQSGDIRVEEVGGWIRAFTGVGNVFLRLIPQNLAGDLSVKVESAIGDITLFLPDKMKATLDVLIDKPPFNAQGFFSDFPVKSLVAPFNKMAAGPKRLQEILNGGGNPVSLHTSSGQITVQKISGR